MTGENKSIDSCNADSNAQLVLRNSIPFGKKFANNDKFNTFVFRNMNNLKIINIHQDGNSQNIFWGWNSLRPIFFHPAKILLNTKAFDLIQINIKTQSAHKMQLKLDLKIVSVFSIKTCLNGANTLTSNNWNKCKVCGNKMNKSIKYFMQKAMKLTIIWLLWLSIINKYHCVRSFGRVFNSKTTINHL